MLALPFQINIVSAILPAKVSPEESALTQITTTTADQLPNENFHVVIWNIYKAKGQFFREIQSNPPQIPFDSFAGVHRR